MSKTDSEQHREIPVQSKTPTRVGVCLSVAYVVSIAIYVCVEWGNLLEMAPNEFGDFMAGAFGPLALFWLVCGYFQQGAELHQNTAALRLQAVALEKQVEELEKSVKHQAAQAEASRAALDFSQEEKARRIEQETSLHAPRLAVAYFAPYTAAAEGLFQVSLKNEGAPAWVLNVESDECIPLTGKLRELEVGVSMSIQAMKPENFDWPSEIKIAVKLNNRLNREVTVVLTFTLDELKKQYADPVLVML